MMSDEQNVRDTAIKHALDEDIEENHCQAVQLESIHETMRDQLFRTSRVLESLRDIYRNDEAALNGLMYAFERERAEEQDVFEGLSEQLYRERRELELRADKASLADQGRASNCQIFEKVARTAE